MESMRVHPATLVGWTLALCGAVFGILGIVSGLSAARVALTWTSAEATVSGLWVERVADNPFGMVTIQLHYGDGSAARDAWVYRSILPSRGESFVRRYSVGSRHTIRLNPKDPTKAEVGVGWNLDLLLVPLAAAGFSLALFGASRWVRKVDETRTPEVRSPIG